MRFYFCLSLSKEGRYTAEKNENTLYKGVILELTVDTDMEEVLCMRIKEDDSYKTIIYHEALYSQLAEKHIGMSILSVAEVTLENMKSEEYATAWEQYKIERNDDGRALMATERHNARRLFLHVLSGNIQCLVVAKDLEMNRL